MGKNLHCFFVVIPLILWMLLSAGVAIAKYVTQKNVTSALNISITAAYTIDGSALQTALKTLSGDSPTTLKFVTGNSSELTGLTCVSDASDGVQASGSGKIGIFQSSDKATIYVAPMNDDGTPADNDKTMAAPVDSSHLLSSSKTGLSTLTSISCANLDTSKVTNMYNMFYNNSKLTDLDISNFDTSKVTNFSNMFNSCSSLTTLNVTNFDTSSATTMYGMFYNNSKLINLDVSKFNTSKVRDFGHMFSGCSSLTDLDVTNFDTSSAVYMNSMFNNALALTDLDISNFDTSKVTNFTYMFCNCSSLTTLDVSKFDTSKVTNFSYMFSGCDSLTSLDVTNFDTSSATNMSGMFYEDLALSTLDLSSFDTSKVTNMDMMFYNDNNLTRIYVSDNFVTDAVTSSSDMFTGCTSLVGGSGTTYDSSHVDKEYAHKDGGTSNPGYFYKKLSYTIDGSALQTALKTLSGNSPTTLKFVTGDSAELTGLTCISAASSGVQASGSDEIGVFQSSDGTTIYVAPMNTDGTPANNNFTMATPVDSSGLLNASNTGLSTLTSISCANLDTSKVTSMSKMFYGNSALTTLDISSFNTSKVTNMNAMFQNCKALTSYDFSNFDTSEVTDMSQMFAGNLVLTTPDVSKLNTSKVTNFYQMFYNCKALTTLDLSNFNTSNVTNFNNMFTACGSLTDLDVTSFDTSSATSMFSMFLNLSSITSLDLSSFDTSNVTDMQNMFNKCSNLTSIYVSDNFVTDAVTYSDEMFYNCYKLVGGSGTTYNYNFIDKTMARIDDKANKIYGYFTRAS